MLEDQLTNSEVVARTLEIVRYWLSLADMSLESIAAYKSAVQGIRFAQIDIPIVVEVASGTYILRIGSDGFVKSVENALMLGNDDIWTAVRHG